MNHWPILASTGKAGTFTKSLGGLRRQKLRGSLAVFQIQLTALLTSSLHSIQANGSYSLRGNSYGG
jgi:hypothetical protein